MSVLRDQGFNTYLTMAYTINTGFKGFVMTAQSPSFVKVLLLVVSALMLNACSKTEQPEPLNLSASELQKDIQAEPEPQVSETFTREEVDHPFGTAPNKVFYPDRAIDTQDLPSIAMAANAKPTDPLHFYEVAPDTFMFFGNIAEVDENNRGSNANAGFIVTSEGVVVIDSLGSPLLGQRMIASIREQTDLPIRYLIITHNHPDHAYGAVAFRNLEGVQVIAHKGTIKYIESDRIDHSIAYRKTFIAKDLEGFKAVKPDITVGGERFSNYHFKLGNKTFEVYNTGEHHSYGDLVVNQVEDGIVWISDLAFNQRVTFMADGHSKAAIEVQSWLLETFSNAKLMIPGHGSAQTAPFPMVSSTQSYMQRLRDTMAKAIDEDIGMQQAIDQTQFDDWKSVPLYEQNQRPNLNFVYREMEQELF